MSTLKRVSRKRVSRRAGAVVGALLVLMWAGASPASAAPAMTVSPSSGPPATQFTVAGNECTEELGPGVGAAAFGRDSNGNGALDQAEVIDEDFAEASEAGAWSIQFTVPAGTAAGALRVEGACLLYVEDSFEYPAGSFTVTGSSSPASLQMSDTTLERGQAVTLQGGGYGPGTSGTAVMLSTPTTLGSGTADSSGVIRLTVTIPSSATSGTHTMELRGVDGAGQARVLSATFTVSGGVLPRTGNGTLRIVAFAGTFTILAGVWILAARRMRTDPDWPI